MLMYKHNPFFSVVMMALSTPLIVLVAALLITTLSYCSAENVYCVTPTATSCSSCPHNTTNCTTLSEYAQEAELYFTSNTTMVFLPGDHVLDIDITVANVARLTMRGESSSDNRATVVCDGLVGLSFTSMVEFKIHSLAFTSCSRRHVFNLVAVHLALFLQSTQYTELVNCSFHDNIAAALLVSNTNITLAGNTEFTHNRACGDITVGGGIIAYDSNLTFTGNTTFLDNCVFEPCGGAILTLENTVLSFNGTSNFINNSAFNGGGAICAKDSTVLSFNGTSNFISNSAASGGGAICALENTALSFNGTSNFISNSAASGGGAILALENTVLSFNGTSNFINNSAYDGGAIYANSTVFSFNGTSYFINNSAFNGGGVIYANSAVLSFNGTSNFISNWAYGGGAILALKNTVLSFNGTIYFTKNWAYVDGGAIFVSDNTVVRFLGINNFINNSAGYGSGGATFISNNTLLGFYGTSNFISNLAHNDGGAIYTINDTVLNFNGTSNFINNSATGSGGGAIYTSDNTTLNFNGTSNFIHNSVVGDAGGAICTLGNTVFIFNGTNNFINNSAVNGGGAIYTFRDTVLSFNGTSNFINNSAFNGGGAIYADSTVLSFNGTSNFISNLAYGGGAIFAFENTVLSFNGTIYFTKNFAYIGAIYTSDTVVRFLGINNFINNSAGYDGGAIFISNNTLLGFYGTSNFISNLAHNGGVGGAIYTIYNTVLSFNGTNNFINNSGDDGGAIYATDSTVLSFNGISNFINNSAFWGGAIYTDENSTLTFNGTIYFTNNGHYGGEGENTVYGGGVFMGLKSTFSMLPNTTVYWENNHAGLGGDIYVKDLIPVSYCTSGGPRYVLCFFQLPGQNLSNGIDVQLDFKNNFADVAGSVLYGGSIDNCKLTPGLDSYNSGKVFNMLVHNNDTDYNTTSNISSNPLRICYCKNNLPDCSGSRYIFLRVYPGETFQVSVAAVGQRNGMVPGTVRSSIDQRQYPGTNLQGSQYLQQTSSTCTQLNYTVLSRAQIQRVVIELLAEGSPCSKFYWLDISVNLFQTCPPGFNVSESDKSCVCEPRLAQFTNSCTIRNGTGDITRESGQQFWVGYDDQSQSDKLILHPLCPYTYCVNHEVTFPLNESDIQCAYNRSGLLCGACKEGYSLLLGTSQCRKCLEDYHLVLLIPFVVMGVAMVILLLVCKLTVATGMLSGLVFYANIVGPNRAIFLPVESTNAFSVFIAWLNLDFGIETCFYDGMDTYSKTWLQFVFPVYILVLVGLMILLSHFSHRFAKLLGNNPVSVLATLILLSYTKILRTLITALYITFLEYPTYNKSVWLYDANIDYLSGKHIPLFIVAVLVFLFLFLPYTLLLLFGQWLQAISHLRLFSWVNRLKPFIDSYHAPYKANHRYWPGLLLVLRFVLLLVFALNLQQDPSVNLLAILVGTGLLVAWAWVNGGVYRNWCLDALEGLFALNLIILVGATYHVDHSHGNQLVVGYTSVSIALATFIGIFVFQLANVTGIIRYLKMKCTALAIRNQADAEVEPLDNDLLPDRLINPEEYEPPFHTPHASAEPTEGANEAQRRPITPVYTYGSIK